MLVEHSSLKFDLPHLSSHMVTREVVSLIVIKTIALSSNLLFHLDLISVWPELHEGSVSSIKALVIVSFFSELKSI